MILTFSYCLVLVFSLASTSIVMIKLIVSHEAGSSITIITVTFNKGNEMGLTPSRSQRAE